MKKVFYVALALALSALVFIFTLIALPMESAPTLGVRDFFAIEHVNIIDVRDGSVINDTTVLIGDGSILEVIPSDDHRKNPGFTSIAARGKYLIPALWDMHTHSTKLSPQLHHPLFIANGVTAVRDMSGCMDRQDNYWACIEDRIRWTNEALTGSRVSPRYISQSSYQTNGGNEVPDGYPSFFKLGSDEDARELVSFYESAGADFVKVYSELSPDQYVSLVEAASLKALAIAGHKPLKVSLSQTISSGQRSIEHGRLFLFECYRDIEDFRSFDEPIKHYNASFMRQILDHQDVGKCSELMQLMAQSDTWWVPTLTTLKMGAYASDPLFRNDSRLQYIPYITRTLIWFPDADRAAETSFSSEGSNVHNDFYEQARSHVNLAGKSGVSLLAGTDNIDSFVFTGSSLHDELIMMVESGLSPVDALKSATFSPAVFSGLEDRFGSIDVGKAADLLLLNANPIKNIHNVKDIYGVMFNGIYYDESALDSLSAFAMNSAQSIQVNVRLLWDLFSSPLMRKQLAD